MSLTTTKTRSGRLVKKPERYVPCETVEDDYSDDPSDDDDDDDFTDDEDSTDDEDDDSDADEYGNLRDFVVPDSDEEENSSQEESE
jgi:hypothetical protein